MIVSDIFSKITTHQIKGIMLHSQMADYFLFLGLKGYAKEQEYHFMHENKMHRKIMHWFISNYNMLLPEKGIENPHVIPTDWNKYTRQQVNATTKQNAVKTALESWEAWEQETKELYTEKTKELIDSGDIVASIKVGEMANDVSCELMKVRDMILCKKAVNYNISDVIGEQEFLCKKYEEKMKKMH